MYTARRVIGLALVAGALLAACGSSTVIDQAKLQQGIVDKGKEGKLTFTSVDCPKDRKAKQGDTFSCTATLDSGATVTVNVTQTDGNGNVDVTLADTVIDGSVFSSHEGQIIGDAYGVSVTLKCDTAIVVKNGDTFTCQGTDDTGQARTVTFTAVDVDKNNYTYVVDGLPPPSTTSSTDTSTATS